MTKDAEAHPTLHQGNCLRTMLTTGNPITSLPVISHQLALQEWARSRKAIRWVRRRSFLKLKVLTPLLLICACLLLNAHAMLGQNTTGSITGRLTDPSGAVIAG